MLSIYHFRNLYVISLLLNNSSIWSLHCVDLALYNQYVTSWLWIFANRLKLFSNVNVMSTGVGAEDMSIFPLILKSGMTIKSRFWMIYESVVGIEQFWCHEVVNEWVKYRSLKSWAYVTKRDDVMEWEAYSDFSFFHVEKTSIGVESQWLKYTILLKVSESEIESWSIQTLTVSLGIGSQESHVGVLN